MDCITIIIKTHSSYLDEDFFIFSMSQIANPAATRKATAAITMAVVMIGLTSLIVDGRVGEYTFDV